jgi:hypothetical protein
VIAERLGRARFAEALPPRWPLTASVREQMGTLTVVVLGVLIKGHPQLSFAEDEQRSASCRRVLITRSQ